MISDDVKALRREYKEDRAGYRKKKYRRLAEAMALVVQLRGDAAETKAFYELADKKLPKVPGSNLRKNLTAALICYVTCAKSENAVKQVWKQARALDYLIDDQGVDPKDIATEIPKRGGIEAIVKAAAQDSPRRNRIAKSKKSKAEQDDWDELDTDEKQDLTTVTLQLNTKLLAEVMGVKASRRIKLICTRLDHDPSSPAVAEIQRVRRLKK
ncbi:hypothetical protein V5279_36100 [Bradyrhizobium sp. 26S5]|uniref:hypothetical protein n=1 Tax=Bradyrhizobium sp. 26S5 TaxID=3139729 RepID=UPI0030D379AB